MKNKIPELVLPGGDLHRVKIAFLYGADAVYVGLNKHSLRKAEVRFDIPQIGKAIELGHSLNKKIYVTFNIFAHNNQLSDIAKDMKKIANFKPDAFIIADPGIVALSQKVAPKIPIHLSTQANTINSESVKFWQKQGVKRIVLGREVTLAEIKEIKKAVPKMELEVFVHGAMCISYSGRCLLSAALTGRSANLGECTQPCRWPYKLKQEFQQMTNDKLKIPNKSQKSELGNLEIDSKFSPRVEAGETQNSKFYLEETSRPGELFEIQEDENGTYIMNSKDLCLIEHLDKIAPYVDALKVEGRNKTDFYLASVGKIYRSGLDLLSKHSATPLYVKKKRELKKEAEKITHRPYTTGFLFGDAKKGETFNSRSPIYGPKYVGCVLNAEDKKAEILVKNKIETDTTYELISPEGLSEIKITEITDKNGKIVIEANPGEKDKKVFIKTDKQISSESFLRDTN